MSANSTSQSMSCILTDNLTSISHEADMTYWDGSILSRYHQLDSRGDKSAVQIVRYTVERIKMSRPHLASPYMTILMLVDDLVQRGRDRGALCSA